MAPEERAQKFHTREMKIHVYAQRQTSDSSWEFLRIEKKQIKNCPEQFLCIKTGVKLLIF